ncbi:MAG: glycosyl hydrolase 115 family protein, partial [Prolixibacteraceae bacterium]|nr:glycosyl hydrolase 115 family protein [Prolixibacteraceae bacterium]
MNFFSHKVLFCAFALFILYSCNTNKKNELMVFDKEKPNSFTLANKQGGAPFIIDAAEDDVVGIAVDMTATDILTITGNKPEVSSSLSKQIPHVVIVGTIGRSSFINQLIDEGKIDVSQIKDQWEAHQLEIIDKPFDGVEKALVITGSDRRGTAYGLVELSRMMGVSPWVWWADVVPEKQKALYLTGPKKVVKTPSVQYRGIFLNDEDWALQPWAAKNIDTDIEDIGSKTYAKIFELMIRLKANTIWPAMHPCTKAFYFYPENKVVADKYAIVVGASHCEPLNRNNVFEWNMNFENEYGEATGDWRYDTNKRQIHRYWNDRVAESHQYENFYTIGMRGIHDSGMPGPREQDKKIELLEKVINDQREIFSSHFAGNEQVPQLFCPYKEVLTLYQSGLELPDDITLVWDDDNHGYIRKLSTPEEQERSGGSGVYYHISYWGKPHDYLWLTTTSPSLMAYQMHKAYQFNAR